MDGAVEDLGEGEFHLPDGQARGVAGLLIFEIQAKGQAPVREALELQQQGKSRTKAKPLTLAEALADLRGTISGPSDLSTNPRHLEGFGK